MNNIINTNIEQKFFIFMNKDKIFLLVLNNLFQINHGENKNTL